MSILVTGCNSFLGYHLLNLLPLQEREIIAVSPEPPPEPLRLTGVRYTQTDLTDYKQTHALLSETKPSEIYHLVSQEFSLGSTGLKPSSLLQLFILGAYHLFEAARQVVPKARILFVSSAEIYGGGRGVMDVIHRESDPALPLTPYATAVASCELLVKQFTSAYHSDIVVARAFGVTGPHQDRKFVLSSAASQIASIELYDGETAIYTGNLDVSRDYLDVRDHARALVLLVKRGNTGEVYNICSGKVRTIRDLVQFLISLSKCPIEIRIDPALERAIDIPLLVGSPEKLMTLTGWKPMISLEDSLRDLYGEIKVRLAAEHTTQKAA
ncbi:MAG TPA: epimerase [Fibrobacteres bacterium]|jgi:GDP-4-dehydro-6-deoxy-D-mannose reductase|nr:epimerase [Fibrobacterota bacterium]